LAIAAAVTAIAAVATATAVVVIATGAAALVAAGTKSFFLKARSFRKWLKESSVQ